MAPKGAGSGGAGEPHVAICIAEWTGQPARCQAGCRVDGTVGDGAGVGVGPCEVQLDKSSRSI